MNLSALERRVSKMERSASGTSTLYLMPDNTIISLNDRQRRQGTTDALFGVTSFEGNVMLTAVQSNDGSSILSLIQSIVNPILTTIDPEFNAPDTEGSACPPLTNTTNKPQL